MSHESSSTQHLPQSSTTFMPSPPDDSTHAPSKSSQIPPNPFQSPASPPLSTTNSHVESTGNSSPFTATAITPPASAPMSAQASQQAGLVSSEPLHQLQPHPSLPPKPSMITPVTAPALDNSSDVPRPKSSLGKRKSDSTENDGDGDNTMPAKRVRLEDVPSERDAEVPVKDVDADGDVEMEIDDSPISPHDVEKEQEQMDTSPLYKLCQKPVPRARPHPTDDLFTLFNLKSIATSVARRDEVTGDKINKLRKSYANHIKDLTSGRNDAVATEGVFMDLLAWPEEEYYNQRIHGKALKDGFPPEVLAKLDAAVKMTSAKLPPKLDAEWRHTLSLDEPAVPVKAPEQQLQAAQRVKTPAARAATPLQVKASTPRAGVETDRPKRQGAKRRYNEDSFDGYEATYDEDKADSVISLNDDEDGRRGSGSKRRKRKASIPTFLYVSTSTQASPAAVSARSPASAKSVTSPHRTNPPRRKPAQNRKA